MQPLRIEMPLMELVEQWVATHCILLVKQRYPKHGTANFKHHDDADAMFQTLFDNIMDDMKITLVTPGYPNIMLPLHPHTTLKLEATYAK